MTRLGHRSMGSMDIMHLFRLKDMVRIDGAASIQNISGLSQGLPADFVAGSSSKIDRMQKALVMTWSGSPWVLSREGGRDFGDEANCCRRGIFDGSREE
jgi:hypothetical protein